MLTIRLQRSGKRNQPEFRIVLAEKTAAASKKFVEILGNYNPRNKAFNMNQDRLNYWMTQRVELSPTMHNLLVSQKLLDKFKVKAFNIPKKPAEPAAETSAPASTNQATPVTEPAQPASDASAASDPATTPAEPVVEPPQEAAAEEVKSESDTAPTE